MPLAPYDLEQCEEDIGTLRGQLAYLGEIGSALDTGIPGTAGASFPGITVVAASLTTIASAVVPANNADTNAVYQLEVNGKGVWGSTQQTLQFACVFGGQVMRSVQLGAIYSAASLPFSWKCRIRVICASTGVSGAWASEVEGHLSVNNTTLLTSGASSANPTNSFFNCDITAPFTVDTTIAETLALQCAWGGTTGAPTLTSGVAIFRRIA